MRFSARLSGCEADVGVPVTRASRVLTKSPRIRIDNRTSYPTEYVIMFFLLYVYLRDNQERILSCDRNNNVVFSLIFVRSPHDK